MSCCPQLRARRLDNCIWRTPCRARSPSSPAGTRAQNSPAVSPDGSKLVFLESATDTDIVSVDVATAVVTSVIATQRAEQMPAWAPRESALVYVTDRNGAMEIWMRKPGQPDRPLVTPRDFPPGTTDGLMGPALSPDGTRVIYGHLPKEGQPALWMSAVAGGPPVRVVKSAIGGDYLAPGRPTGIGTPTRTFETRPFGNEQSEDHRWG